MSIQVGRLESLCRFRSADSNRCVDSGRPTRIAASIQVGRLESLCRFRPADPTPPKIRRGRPEPKGPTQHLALAQPLRPSLITATAFLICSRVSVSVEIKPHCLALAPETESVKHRDRTKEQPKDCHTVSVEGMSRLVGNCPRLDMYLPSQTSKEQPVPFWSVKPTHVEAEANMELIYVAVSVGVSTGIIGELHDKGVGVMLGSYINPESTVKVILPLYVNHRTLEFGDQLLYYKPAEAPDEKKRKALEEVDPLADFVRNRQEARKRRKESRAPP